MKDYSSIEEQVNNSIAEGGSLRKACTELGVPVQSYLDWVEDDRERYRRYSRAKEIRAEILAADTLDLITKLEQAQNSLEVQIIRAKIDAIKWLSAKFYPKMYGDRSLPEPGKPEDPLEMLTEDQKIRMHTAWLKSKGYLVTINEPPAIEAK